MITFDVIGHPRPQGSKQAFVNKYTGKAQMKESSGDALTTWRQDVKAAALNAIAELPGFTPLDGPVTVTTTYRFARSKSHYRTGRNAHILRDDAPARPTGRNVGDIEKLARSTHDALTAAGIWTDDSLVAGLHAQKVYLEDGELPGALITITTLNPVAAPTSLPGAATALPISVPASTSTPDAGTVQEALL